MNKFEQYFHEATQFQFKTWELALNNNPMLKAGRDLLIELERLVPGSESLIVGGSVRDLVLGHELKDVDIATNININKITQHFKTDNIGKSKDFGIVNVHYQGYEFEVANFRTEEGYTDKRRPDKVNIAKSYEQDSSRRDFTINALGIDKNGQIVDYHNGLEDLKNGLIRTVGDARLRFTEDALRIYRLFRFAAKNGFSIEPETLKAAEELVQLGQTDSLAIERITDELFKAASKGPSLAKYIEHLDRSGLLEKILPEISALKGKQQPPEHHPEGDAYMHTLCALKASRSTDPLTNIAILLHDCGKSVTYKNREGKHTFYGHESVGTELVDTIARRLKLSDHDRDAIKFAAGNHQYIYGWKKLNKKTIANLVGNPNWNVLRDVGYADAMSRKFGSDKFSDDSETLNNIQSMENIFAELSAGGGALGLKNRIKQLVDGKKILQWFPGIQGHHIGKILNDLQAWIINDNKFTATEDEVKQKAIEFYEKTLHRL